MNSSANVITGGPETVLPGVPIDWSIYKFDFKYSGGAR